MISDWKWEADNVEINEAAAATPSPSCPPPCPPCDLGWRCGCGPGKPQTEAWSALSGFSIYIPFPNMGRICDCLSLQHSNMFECLPLACNTSLPFSSIYSVHLSAMKLWGVDTFHTHTSTFWHTQIHLCVPEYVCLIGGIQNGGRQGHAPFSAC